MATLTSKLLLRKPATTDLINVTTDISDNMDKIDNASSGILGRVILDTAAQGPFAVETDITGATVTFTPVANRKLKVTATVSYQQSAAGSGLELKLKEGATVLGIFHHIAVNAIIVTVNAIWEIDAPTAAAHTYKLSANIYNGGNVTIQNLGVPDGYPFGLLLVEDMST